MRIEVIALILSHCFFRLLGVPPGCMLSIKLIEDHQDAKLTSVSSNLQAFGRACVRFVASEWTVSPRPPQAQHP